MSHEELPLFVRWETFLDRLLDYTEKFPKRVRFTFSTRLDNLALDILENIVEAAYKKKKKEVLWDTNLKIQKMRVLVRICYRRKFLSQKAYEYAIHELYETGKMVGGWLKS